MSDKHITDKFVSVDRYYISGLHPHIWKHPEGEMVYFDDYVNLWVEKERLKAEVERLRASSFVTAVPSEDYEKLKAEVERLKIYDVEHWQDQWLLVVEDNNKLRAEVDRLRKAGDAIESALREMPGDHPRCLANEWLAAKEGRPNE